MNADWRARYELAVAATRRAGRTALGYFETALNVEYKGDQSPVTVADRNAEQLLRQEIEAAFPDDGLLGEEFGEKDGSSGFRWIMDPIDGTRSFVRGIPLWGTLVGVECRGEVVIGTSYLPVWDNMFHAMKGDGAYEDGRRITVSKTATLKESLLIFSSPVYFTQAGKTDQFLRFVEATERPRGYGDFYGFVLVASGRADVMIEQGCNSWDLAGPKIIVEEAGGKFTDWGGTPTVYRPDVLVSNGLLHEESLAILQS